MLLGAIEEFQFDCAIGGARRDEEKARAKERFFSFRDSFGQWDPKKQRPGDLESLQRPRESRRKHARVPALELDRDGRVGIHQAREARSAEHLLQSRARVFPTRRPMAARSAAAHGCIQTRSLRTARDRSRTSRSRKLVVRVRTIADMISTGMIESPADSVDDIIGEVSAARVTERGTRADDKASEAAMEDRKKAGYF